MDNETEFLAHEFVLCGFSNIFKYTYCQLQPHGSQLHINDHTEMFPEKGILIQMENEDNAEKTESRSLIKSVLE